MAYQTPLEGNDGFLGELHVGLRATFFQMLHATGDLADRFTIALISMYGMFASRQALSAYSLKV